MAQTQKMYLGGVPVIKNYFGANPIVMAGAIALVNPALQIDWLLLGGGGSGGTAASGQSTGGGGGAGRFVSSSASIPFNDSVSITYIGSGGVGKNTYASTGAAGGDSTVIINSVEYSSPGGGRGGSGTESQNVGNAGGDGGSGGGAGRSGTYGIGGTAVAGSPIAGFGSNGAAPNGVGGGAGGTPTGLAWVDGTTYCVGGGINSASNSNTAGSGTSGTLYLNPSATAKNGLFKLRYLGTPKATGGTITESGGYTYHTFATTGTFTYTG